MTCSAGARPPTRPAWIDIDLSAIAANIAAVKAWVDPHTDVMAVVKANAYGHGLVPAARAALEGGAAALGVALLEEGLALRAAGIRAPVVVLGCALPQQAEALVDADLSQVVSQVDTLRALSRAARARQKPGRVHLKIDTGMGRVGVAPDAVLALAAKIHALPNLVLEGVATHIAWEAARDMPRARQQIARFRASLRALRQAGCQPRWRHAANSVTTVQIPNGHFDLVRVGLLTYGIPPAGGASGLILRPALALKARITQLRDMQPGQTLSYGGTCTLSRPARVGLVPLGYADGYSRRLSNRASVLVRGQRCPVVGAVCMDQFLIDVTDVPAPTVGEEVVLLGPSAPECISVAELAAWMDGIAHEVVSQLAPRLPRHYHTAAEPPESHTQTNG